MTRLLASNIHGIGLVPYYRDDSLACRDEVPRMCSRFVKLDSLIDELSQLMH